jgi:hypothetical protein
MTFAVGSNSSLKLTRYGRQLSSNIQKMKTRIAIGIWAVISCLAMPFLCRIPRGGKWVAQYLPDEGNLISGMLFLGAFAFFPVVLVFCAGLISKPPFYLPVVISTLVALTMLGYWHHDNDLAADAQAAISLIFIPIYAGAFALIGGLIGFGLQALFRTPPNKT